jgi:TM2 domain-containing membrane protein YozV
MNCANHADTSAVAYCRTCGKALCANCTRPVKGVIYCEDCLGAKMAGTAPPAAASFAPNASGGAPGYAPAPPVTPGSGPNPALAGILAGFFPFGVGAVYTGQYAKGLAHLIIFGLLVAGASASDHSGGEMLGVICGLGIAFFYVYQIIDSVRSAKALQMGQAPPDPFNLAQTFSGGERIDAKRIPTGAVILILVGVFFLLHTLGMTEFGVNRFWPILLIVLGAWMFARNFGLLGNGSSAPLDPRYHTRRLMGPAIITTIGILFLLSELRVAYFDRTWPIILLVIGGVKLLQSSAIGVGPGNPPGPGVGPTSGGGTVVPPAPPSEVSHG